MDAVLSSFGLWEDLHNTAIPESLCSQLLQDLLLILQDVSMFSWLSHLSRLVPQLLLWVKLLLLVLLVVQELRLVLIKSAPMS